MSEIAELIERLEKAEGPCFALEGEIWRAISDVDQVPPNFTYSFDAARMLVPQGSGISVQGNGDCWYAVVAGHYSKKSPNPAIALCIAALRAIEASHTPPGSGG